ncbi:MAG: hypothetical protein NTW73_01480 [Candidatus Parcubacteria bacterium]|nr:hypothetical protein [Candidatus Parcubacteria bacterium]
MEKQLFVIIDGNALIHRAFHALPGLTNSNGQMTNAVYGFVSVLIRILRELKPQYIACCFDLAAPTFRHEVYQAYKATRKKGPQELYDQLEPAKDFVRAFNIKIFEQAGFEADDLIGSLASQASIENSDLEIIIVTGDLDTLQLVTDKIKVWALKTGIKEMFLYDLEKIKERFGLDSIQLPDYKGLKGDPSDNIIGVPGIGEKTASQLIQKYGSLERLYEAVTNSEFSGRVYDLLSQNKDQAFFSRDLSLIKKDISLDFKIENIKFELPSSENLKDIFEKYGFRSLWLRLEGINAEPIQKEQKKQIINTSLPGF